MIALVCTLVIFVGAGVGFLWTNLLVGQLLRPAKPAPEKGDIYECGEPTIGSSWIQFDLRFYVVALLFVIFDVEMAFFFPWAVAFGTTNQLADESLSPVQRHALADSLLAPVPSADAANTATAADAADVPSAFAKRLAWFLFLDILVFFGVLLVGFAYLWKRGDLDWVRSLASQK